MGYAGEEWEVQEHAADKPLEEVAAPSWRPLAMGFVPLTKSDPAQVKDQDQAGANAQQQGDVQLQLEPLKHKRRELQMKEEDGKVGEG